MANITTQTIRVDLSTDKTIPTAFTHQNDTATRNGATNATIICKASENTTYNGDSFSAGDTILTSTP